MAPLNLQLGLGVAAAFAALSSAFLPSHVPTRQALVPGATCPWKPVRAVRSLETVLGCHGNRILRRSMPHDPHWADTTMLPALLPMLGAQAAFSRRVSVSMSSILDRKPKPKVTDVSGGSMAGGLFTSSSPETRR